MRLPMLSSAGFCAINDSELLIIGGLNSVNQHHSKAYLFDTNKLKVRELRHSNLTFDYSCPDNQLVVINKNNLLAKVAHGHKQIGVKLIDLRVFTRERC